MSNADAPITYYHQTKRWIEGIGTTLSSVSVKVDVGVRNAAITTMFQTSQSYQWLGGLWSTSPPAAQAVSVAPSKLRIYKYKTA